MRRDANGARDFFAPMEIGEEVLTESLASHGCNSVAGGAGTLRLRSGQAGGLAGLDCGVLLVLKGMKLTVTPSCGSAELLSNRVGAFTS